MVLHAEHYRIAARQTFSGFSVSREADVYLFIDELDGSQLYAIVTSSAGTKLQVPTYLAARVAFSGGFSLN